jgi:cellulose 1,4-beta-cellobiosidase
MHAKLAILDGHNHEDSDENTDHEETEHEETEYEETDQEETDSGEDDGDGEKWDGLVNPFEGKTLYVNPTYQENLEFSISTASGSAKENLKKMRNISSAYWIDIKAKLHGDDTWSLEGILNDAADKGHMVTVLAYNLPNRDCAADASMGEMCCKYLEDGRCDYSFSGSCEAGLNEYKSDYIDKYADILSQFEGKVDIALVIEPDSLPNMATNMGMEACANSKNVYIEGNRYAINAFAEKAPSVALYLDAAHGGWLGWDVNIIKFADTVKGLPYQKLRGFATNVSNT